MRWNSHVYVVHGIVYRWTASSTPEGSGQTENCDQEVSSLEYLLFRSAAKWSSIAKPTT